LIVNGNTAFSGTAVTFRFDKATSGELGDTIRSFDDASQIVFSFGTTPTSGFVAAEITSHESITATTITGTGLARWVMASGDTGVTVNSIRSKLFYDTVGSGDATDYKLVAQFNHDIAFCTFVDVSTSLSNTGITFIGDDCANEITVHFTGTTLTGKTVSLFGNGARDTLSLEIMSTVTKLTGNQFTLDGGDGSDTFDVLFSVDTSGGSFSSNTVSIKGGAGNDSVSFDFLATVDGTVTVSKNVFKVTVGSGDDFVDFVLDVDGDAKLSANTIEVLGSGGADTLSVQASAITSDIFNNIFSVFGGAGVDDIDLVVKAENIGNFTATAVSGNVFSVSGGGGADDISLQLSAANADSADFSAFFIDNTFDVEGGTGADVISLNLDVKGSGKNASFFANTLTVGGDGGGDTITVDVKVSATSASSYATVGSNVVSVFGGTGSDVLSVFMSAVGSGVLAFGVSVYGNVLLVDVGSGSDVITVGLNAQTSGVVVSNDVSVLGGDGADSITLSLTAGSFTGNTFFVQGGKGADLIVNGNATLSGTTVTFHYDTFSELGDTIRSFDDDDVKLNFSFKTIGTGGDFLTSGVNPGKISHVTGTTVGAATARWVLAAGDTGTSVNAIRSKLFYDKGTGGSDYVLVAQLNHDICFDLKVIVTNPTPTAFTGGTCNDLISLKYTSTSAAAPLTGVDVTVFGLGGNDSLFVDLVNTDIKTNTVSLFGGSGDDLLRIRGFILPAVPGDSELDKNEFFMDGGAGSDTLSFTAAQTTYTFNNISVVGGVDDDVINFNFLAFKQKGNSVFIDGGAGDDTFNLSFFVGVAATASVNDYVVKGGLGADTFVNAGLDLDTTTHKLVFQYDNLSEIGSNSTSGGDVFQSYDSSTLSYVSLRFNSLVFRGDSVTADGDLDAGRFKANAGGDAGDTNDYWLYDTVADKLFYDADGTGAASKRLVAEFNGHAGAALTAGHIKFTSVTGVANNAPVLFGLGGTVNNGGFLGVGVLVSDAELDVADEYSGASLMVGRAAVGTGFSANANDLFSFGLNTTGTLVDVGGSKITDGGGTIATYNDTGGVLTVNFLSAEADQVDDIIQGIRILNTTTSSSFDMRYIFNDGETGVTPNSLTDTGVQKVLCTVSNFISLSQFARTTLVFTFSFTTSGGACDDTISLLAPSPTYGDFTTAANLRVHGNGGDDNLSYSFSGIRHTNNFVTLFGEGGSDTLDLSLFGSFVNTNSLFLEGGTGNDLLNVSIFASVISGLNLSAFGGSGNDTITLGIKGSAVVQNTLNVRGGLGSDVFVRSFFTYFSSATLAGTFTTNLGVRFKYDSVAEITSGLDSIKSFASNGEFVFSFNAPNFAGDMDSNGRLDSSALFAFTTATIGAFSQVSELWVFTSPSDILFYDTNGTASVGGFVAVADFTQTGVTLTSNDIIFY